MTFADALRHRSEPGFPSAASSAEVSVSRRIPLRLFSPRRAELLLFAYLLLGVHVRALGQGHTTWSDYGGGPDSAQYSALREINRTNVSKLQIAWVFPTGDENRYFFNPIEAHGLTYVMAENNSIVALNAETGKEVWAHKADPHTEIITDRGINYWESKDGRDRRLLFASNHFLQAIDARTGKPILSFGTNGRVDLKQGLGRDPQTLSLVQSTTPGRVFEDLLILGSATNRGIRLRSGRYPGIRCAHRQVGMDFSHHPASRRSWVRNLAEGRVEAGGRGQLLGRDLRGRKARNCLRAHSQPQVQLLRR